MRLSIAAGSNVNSVTISGNVTRDPEHKTFGTDGQLCKFGVAVNRTIGKGDERTEEVSFIDVTVFGGFAGLVARKLRKGDAATVQGELRQDRWDTEDGSKRSAVYVVASQIDSDAFFRAKAEDNSLDGATTTSAATEAPQAEATPAATQTDDIPF